MSSLMKVVQHGVAGEVLPKGFDFGEWAGAGTPKKKPKAKKGPRSHASDHRHAIGFATAAIEMHKVTKDGWDRATPAWILGLYSVLHEKVYGVFPSELDGPDYLPAVAAAKRAIEELGSAREAYEFVRWAWLREEFKLQAGADSARMGWRLQFHASKITDYRVHRARSGKRTR